MTMIKVQYVPESSSTDSEFSFNRLNTNLFFFFPLREPREGNGRKKEKRMMKEICSLYSQTHDWLLRGMLFHTVTRTYKKVP